MITLDYPDACPACPPGDHSACLPVNPPEEVNGGTLAGYQHEFCGTAWSAWFDRYGWVTGRAIAPVSPERGAENREVLRLALEEQDREQGNGEMRVAQSAEHGGFAGGVVWAGNRQDDGKVKNDSERRDGEP